MSSSSEISGNRLSFYLIKAKLMNLSRWSLVSISKEEFEKLA